MTTSPVTPVITPDADLSELATSVSLQQYPASQRQLTLLNAPLTAHVAVPLPLYPASQATATVSPVTPVMLPATDLSELATSVALQLLAVQLTVSKLGSRSEPSLLVVQ